MDVYMPSPETGFFNKRRYYCVVNTETIIDSVKIE